MTLRDIHVTFDDLLLKLDDFNEFDQSSSTFEPVTNHDGVPSRSYCLFSLVSFLFLLFSQYFVSISLLEKFGVFLGSMEPL